MKKYLPTISIVLAIFLGLFALVATGNYKKALDQLAITREQVTKSNTQIAQMQRTTCAGIYILNQCLNSSLGAVQIIRLTGDITQAQSPDEEGGEQQALRYTSRGYALLYNTQAVFFWGANPAPVIRLDIRQDALTQECRTALESGKQPIQIVAQGDLKSVETKSGETVSTVMLNHLVACEAGDNVNQKDVPMFPE